MTLNKYLVTLALLLATQLVEADDKLPAVDYLRQVKPILTRHCVGCHGIDKHESGYRLDIAELAIQGGDRGAVIVPGKSAESILVQALEGDGDVSRMPLDKPSLSPAEIELIRRWVEQGAGYPESEKVVNLGQVKSEHWAFQSISRPLPPTVRNRHWVRNPIDAFVLARLEEEKIHPSPEANRETLIRRLSLDLLGVPPTIEQIDRYLHDASPDAYEKLVERIFASPRYGERWGRHWLDLARYADSDGFTIDAARKIWKYRDWVINALNADYSFDRFTREQMAGDMLENSTLQQRVATGFHRNTLINQEGGTDDEQFRVEAVVDRVNTIGSIYLGLTIGCAQCHQHKFDPITQQDFYQLYALFNNCTDNNDANGSGPIIEVPSEFQVKRRAELQQHIAVAEKPLQEHDSRFVAGLPGWEKQLAELGEVSWESLDPAAWSTLKGAILNKLEDKSLLVDFSVPANDTYVVTYETTLEKITAVRLETLSHKSLPSNGPGRAENGNFVLTEFEISVEPIGEKKGEPQPIKIARAVADHSQDGYSVTDCIDGKPDTGWAINVKSGSANVNREAIFFPSETIRSTSGVRLTIKMHHDLNTNYLVGCFRLSVSDQPRELLSIPTPIREIATLDKDKRTAPQQQQLEDAYKATDKERGPLASRVNTLKKELELLGKAIPTTMVLQEMEKPRQTHIQIRGDFLREGDLVEPAVPAVLPPLEKRGDRPDRLDFADWLTSSTNPLTARVTVNRFWQRFFGIGIVETENDFGTQGIPPEHPELLDWLASEFIRLDWGIKNIHRTIVLSATYRQSSRVSEELLKRDPRNKLLARQTRIRLEAEVVRDQALGASGLLSTTMGGPGVYPPQPEGIYILTQQKKAWPESQGDARYRRALYTFFWRSSPYPLMPTFDAPGATTTCTQRSRSNTPLQALMLANDRAFFEFAQGLASQIMRADISQDEQRLTYAFRRSLSRLPSEQELTRLLKFFEAQREHFKSTPADAAQVAPTDRPEDVPLEDAAAWTAVSRVLFNLDEFITRE
jgi:mono/diheme cytochrome c family protein